MAEDLGERTEDASPRKLQQAREQGQLAKSTDLSSAVDLIFAVIGLAMLGTLTMTALASVMRRAFSDPAALIDPDSVGPILRATFRDGTIAILPFLGVMVLGALISQYLQVGFLFTTKPLEPKLDRLDPVKGFGKLFQRRNLVKTLINTVKLFAVMLVAYLVLSRDAHKLVMLAQMSAMGAMKTIGGLALNLAIALLAILLIIGIIDYSYQRWQFQRDQRMSKVDVKDERRSMEGDPEIKARRYRMSRQIAMQRLNSAVPKADVVITNPTHFAIAIKYDQKKGRAPIVVAKGADEMAHRIRQLAMIHQVPIVERPPLARAIYAAVRVGQEIAPEFYQAVAEILAYVYRLDRSSDRLSAVAPGAARFESQRPEPQPAA